MVKGSDGLFIMVCRNPFYFMDKTTRERREKDEKEQDKNRKRE